jgi:hypothetical protein
MHITSQRLLTAVKIRGGGVYRDSYKDSSAILVVQSLILPVFN